MIILTDKPSESAQTALMSRSCGRNGEAADVHAGLIRNGIEQRIVLLSMHACIRFHEA